MKWILIRLDNGSKFNLSDDVLLYPIGRAKECLIKCQSLYSSRQHCDVICDEDKIYIVDLKSANGTFLNGNRIIPEKATLLQENDLVGIGVPDIVDSKSIVFKVALERDKEVPATQLASTPSGTRKRNASDPVESLPTKMTRLDVKPVVNGSSHPKNLDLEEKIIETSDHVLPTVSNDEQLISSTSEEDQTHCGGTKNCSSESKNPQNISPLKDSVSEVIDLAESGSDDEIVWDNRNNKITPSDKKVTEVPQSINTSSGYTDETDVIVISDDEDDFFSSSMQAPEKENDSEEEGHMNNNDLAPPIKKEPLPEKAWESSEDESDNEWWSKLSQSFSESMENCVMEEPKPLTVKVMGDDVESNEAEGEDKQSPVDTAEGEKLYGNWFPVLSQDFSESDDEVDGKEEEGSEDDCEKVDLEVDKVEDKDNMREGIVQGSEVKMEDDCDTNVSDEDYGIDKNIDHMSRLGCSATVSDCAQELEMVRISENEVSSKDEGDGQEKRKSHSPPLDVSTDRTRTEEKGKGIKHNHVRELMLHLGSKKSPKGPLIVSPPTSFKRGRCIWESEGGKEPEPSLVTPPQSSLATSSNDEQPASGVELKQCSVILEDIMYGKNSFKSKGRKNKADAVEKMEKTRKRKETRNEALSKEDKRKIKEKRKEKLQALSDKGLKELSPQVDAPSKTRDAPNVSSTAPNVSSTANLCHTEKISPDSRPGKVVAKVTTKNRGAFLMEFDLFASSGSSSHKKGKQSKKQDGQGSKSQNNVPQIDNWKLSRIDSGKQSADDTRAEHPESSRSGFPAVDGNPSILLSNPETRKATVGILKPSNSIKDDRKGKLSVCFKEEPEVRFFNVSPGVKMMPIKGKDYPLMISPVQRLGGWNSTFIQCTSIMTVVYDICRWNALWLEEQRSKAASEPPPVHLDHRVSPITGTYSSYVEYSKCVYPILLYEMWARIYKDWDQNFARNPVIQVLLLSQNDMPEGLTSEQEFICVNCQSVISEKDVQNNDYPKVGDLAILEFPEESPTHVAGSNHPINDANKVVNVRVFAYVDSVKRSHITPRVQISQSFGPIAQKSNIFQMSVKLKKRKERMCLSQMARLKIVCHLLTELRSFDALLELPKSPLMPHILNPLTQDIKTMVPGHFRVKATEYLNPSQKKAVAMAKMVCSAQEPRICLVQGPPGTGKTKVIISLIMEMFECEHKTLNQKRRDNKTPKILLCAPSNAAIDNLVIKLLNLRTGLPKENRFRMVRVGRLDAMNPCIRDISLQDLTSKELKNNANLNDDENLDLQISTIQAKVNSLILALESVKSRNDAAGQMNIELKLAEHNKKLEEAKKAKTNNSSGNMSNKDMRNLEMATERTVLHCADIVATTLASSANNTMLEAFPRREGFKQHFSCCIIDEACQSLEVESLIPLKLGISNMVLVGDQQQLYPTVMSIVAKQNGLQISLFERLWSSLSMGGISDVAPLVFLDVQYRMHPEICHWPNSHIYQGLIKTPDQLVMERQSPFLPYVIISLEFNQNDPNQLLNDCEAELVSKLYFAMSEKTEKRRYSIGVITPYQKQKDAIESAIMRRKATLGMPCVSQCDVNTIDSFQGQERDVVILSCVRSYKIGFLGERKRINVALTRARRSLVVCGNFNSLKDHELWQAFLSDGLSRGIVRCVSGSRIPNQRELLNLVSRGSHE